MSFFAYLVLGVCQARPCKRYRTPAFSPHTNIYPASYDEASVLKHRISSGNHLYFSGTTALEQFCRTVPFARLHSNTWTIYPDSNLPTFLAQVDDPDQRLLSRSYHHRFDDPFSAFAGELWSQVDCRAYRKHRTAQILLAIQDLPCQGFPQHTDVRVSFGTIKGVSDDVVRRKRDFGICFHIIAGGSAS